MPHKRSSMQDLKHERRKVALNRATNNLKAIHEGYEIDTNQNSDLEHLNMYPAIYPPAKLSVPDFGYNGGHQSQGSLRQQI